VLQFFFRPAYSTSRIAFAAFDLLRAERHESLLVPADDSMIQNTR